MLFLKYALYAMKLFSDGAHAIDHSSGITSAGRQLTSGIYELRTDVNGPNGPNRCPAGFEVPENECLAVGLQVGGDFNLGSGTIKDVVETPPNDATLRLGLCEGNCGGEDVNCGDGLVCLQRSGLSDGSVVVPGCFGTPKMGYEYCVADLSPSPGLQQIKNIGGSPSGMIGLCEGDCDSDDHCEGDMTCEQRRNSQRIAGCSGAPILKGGLGYDYCTDAKYTTKLFPCGCFLWKFPDWPDEVRYNPDTNQCNNGSNNEINSGLVCKKGPWAIGFEKLDTNFDKNSDKELTLILKVSRNRTHKVLDLRMGDCKTPIPKPISGDFFATSEDRNSFDNDATNDELVVKIDIDKSMIADSPMYNAESKVLQVCQIVQLVDFDNSNNEVVVVEERHEIDVTFKLDFDYTTSNVVLEAATNKLLEGGADVVSYVQACKCKTDGSGCDEAESKLLPNAELHVCIYSTSADVGIDYLDSMDVTQISGASTLAVRVITGSVIGMSSLTRLEYKTIEGFEAVMVSTFLPQNTINFADGGEINIKGNVVMKFGTTGRKLQAANYDAIAEGTETASFDLILALETSFETEDPAVSTGMLPNYGFSSLALIFALAFMMW